jgi:hypothetical protein
MDDLEQVLIRLETHRKVARANATLSASLSRGISAPAQRHHQRRQPPNRSRQSW